MAYGLSDAQGRVNQRASSRPGGRALTGDEFTRLAGAVGYAGGDVSDDQLNQAYGFVDQYDFGGPAAPAPAPPAPPAPAPPPGVEMAPSPPQLVPPPPVPVQPSAPQAPPPGVAMAPSPPQIVLPPGVGLQTPGPGGSSDPPPGVAMQRDHPDDFNQIAPSAPQAAPPPPTFSTAPTPPTPAAPAQPSAGRQPGTQSGVNQAVWDRLQQLLGQEYGYDPTSPQNRIQLDVQRSNSQRSAERRRASGAERLAQQGISNTSGGFDTMVDQVNADRGMEDASFEAELVRDSLNKQREDINQALSIGAGLMSADQERNLRRELAAIDAELQREGQKIQREGLAQQGALTREGFGLQREGYASQERIANLDAQLRREGLSVQQLLGMGQLGNQLLGILLDSQLGYDRLGFDYGQLGALLNERAVGFMGR